MPMPLKMPTTDQEWSEYHLAIETMEAQLPTTPTRKQTPFTEPKWNPTIKQNEIEATEIPVLVDVAKQ